MRGRLPDFITVYPDSYISNRARREIRRAPMNFLETKNIFPEHGGAATLTILLYNRIHGYVKIKT
jgi:hypothetical protein